MPRIADRKDEVSLLRKMLLGEVREKVLLVEGPSERGKSVLLAEFAKCAEELFGNGTCARLDLRGGGSLEELFFKLYHDLGPDGFSDFSKHIGGPEVSVTVPTDMSSLNMGNDNTVEVKPTIHVASYRSVGAMGAAIVSDLRSRNRPTLLIVDTFEAATEEAARWFIKHLLAAVSSSQKLFVTLAGQRVPNPDEHHLQWGHIAHKQPLAPVTSVSAWHEFALSLHPEFPQQHIEIICAGLAERPGAIQTFIVNIVRQLPANVRETR